MTIPEQIRREIADLPGLKEDELRPCDFCGARFNAPPVFYRVTVENFAVDVQAARRQLGLGMHLGSAALARVMGPNEDLAKRVSTDTKLVCLDCASKLPMLAAVGA